MRSTSSFVLLLVMAACTMLLGGVRSVCAQPKPDPDEPHSTLRKEKVNVKTDKAVGIITMKPSGATFQIPERWLDWYARFKNNIHLSRADLEKVKDATGEWDKEYAEVVNAVMPFSKCAAHVGGEGWGQQAVFYGDLQMRAYIVDMIPEQVHEKLVKDGVPRASTFSKKVSLAQSKQGEWHRSTISYEMWYGDYSGTAVVELYARAYGKQTAVLVFMHTEHTTSDEAHVQQILKSFTWQTEM